MREGETQLADQHAYRKLLTLVHQVRADRLDDIARLAWLGYGEGDLTDNEAQAVAAAIERRRGRTPWERAGARSAEPEFMQRKTRPFIR
jgi:hypothetical protein